MDGDRQIAAVGSRIPVQRLRALIADQRPDVIAIDAPPAWAPAGHRSRTTERELKLLGIQAYYTPDKATGEANAFYAWMRNGMAAFRAAERAGYPAYRAGTIRGHALEVFPHATVTVLGGCVPPARQTSAAKRAWRAGVLRAQHVPTAQLRTLDQVDAALARAHRHRRPRARAIRSRPGMPDEGRIVLPARVVPAAGYRRCVQTRPFATEPLITFCACGCGAQTRPGSEFRAGHDRKLMVQLERAVEEGERARAELQRRGWT